MPHDPARLTAALRAAALALGVTRVGFGRVDGRFQPEGAALDQWLALGMHGTMAYLAEQGDRADPRALLPGARSMVACALAYAGPAGAEPEPPAGAAGIASYARGDDYHDLLRDKLRALARECRRLAGEDVETRVCVDTAPLLERAAAARAGLAFQGKSTMAIIPGLGTYWMLGVLLTSLELEPDSPVRSGCGSCTACLDACPTEAFAAPYQLDARRCVAFLTIEAHDATPEPLRRALGRRVFGCDACQAVCPFNAAAAQRHGAPELAPRAPLIDVRLEHLLGLRAGEYRRLVRRSALRRSTRHQLARNAAVALGNAGQADATPALVRALEGDVSALVREHAAWALGQLGGADAAHALQRASQRDESEAVRAAASAALVHAERAAPRGG